MSYRITTPCLPAARAGAPRQARRPVPSFHRDREVLA